MKNITVYSLICIAILTSCSRSKYDRPSYTYIPDAIKLKGEAVVLSDSIFFHYPLIKIKDSLCCIWDSRQDQQFHVLTYPEFEYIYSVGTTGRGPNELLSVADFDITSKYLYTYERISHKLYAFDIKNRKTVPAECVDFSMLELQEVNRFCMIDSLAAVYTTSLQNKIYILNKTGNIVDSLLKRPEDKDTFMAQRMDVWQSFISYHNGNIVCATLGGEVIDVINREKNKHSVFVGPEGKAILYKRGNGYMAGSFRGFCDLFLTDNYIYTLFSGVKWDEIREMTRRGENPYKLSIRVYDYNGNLVKVYITDEDVISLYVDETTNKIYATVENNENSIFVYQM